MHKGNAGRTRWPGAASTIVGGLGSGSHTETRIFRPQVLFCHARRVASDVHVPQTRSPTGGRILT